MKLRYVGLAIMLVVLPGIPAKAAGDLNFYFTTPGDGAPGHTISGEILGLTEGTTGATDILIFSDPTNPRVTPTLYSLSGNGYFFTNNTFTVSAGVVTAADALWYKETSPYSGQVDDQFYFNAFGSTNGERDDLGVTNTNGNQLAGTTYNLASPVPEPSQWGCGVFLAVVLVGLLKRFSRKPSLVQ